MRKLIACEVLIAFVMLACEPDNPVDPTCVYEWRVENLTDNSLRVATRFKDDLVESGLVTAGHIQIIVREEAFLGGPTSPSKAQRRP